MFGISSTEMEKRVDIHALVVQEMEDLVDGNAEKMIKKGITIEDGLKVVEFEDGKIKLLARVNREDPWRWDQNAKIGREFNPGVDRKDPEYMFEVQKALVDLRDKLELE